MSVMILFYDPDSEVCEPTPKLLPNLASDLYYFWRVAVVVVVLFFAILKWFFPVRSSTNQSKLRGCPNVASSCNLSLNEKTRTRHLSPGRLECNEKVPFPVE